MIRMERRTVDHLAPENKDRLIEIAEGSVFAEPREAEELARIVLRELRKSPRKHGKSAPFGP